MNPIANKVNHFAICEMAIPGDKYIHYDLVNGIRYYPNEKGDIVQSNLENKEYVVRKVFNSLRLHVITTAVYVSIYKGVDISGETTTNWIFVKEGDTLNLSGLSLTDIWIKPASTNAAKVSSLLY